MLTPKSNIEYKKISDFATITRGGSFQKSDFVDVGRPAIHYGKIYTNYGISTGQTLNYINEEVFNKSRKAQPNDIVMAVTSENVEDVCKCVAWLGNEDVAVSGHTAIIHHNQNPKYLSYYFHTSMFAKQKEKLAHGTKVIEVTPDRLNDIEIPIPPMDVQNRIVEVLDNFDKICNDFEIGLVFEIELLRSIDINIDYILMLVQKYHDTHCNDKEILVNIQKAIDASPELRSKKKLIENFINNINDVDDVMAEWRSFLAEEKEKELMEIITSENLKEEETRKFIEDCFKNGKVKTTGTDIDKILPPIRLFGGGNRQEKKQIVIEKITVFFDHFYGLI